LNASLASRIEKAESHIPPLTDQLGRLDAQLSDTKALMHLELKRRSNEVQELVRDTDNRLAQANGEVSGLSARLAGLEQRTDEPLGRLVGEVAALRETGAAYASILDRQGGILEDQRRDAGTLRTRVERQDEELVSLKNHASELAVQLAGLENRTDEPLERVVGEVTVLKETAAAYANSLAAHATSLDRHGAVLEAQRVDAGTLRTAVERQEQELVRLAAQLADIEKGTNEPLEGVTSQLKEVSRNIDAHSAELASIGHQLVMHVAKMADLRKICSDLEIGAHASSSVSDSHASKPPKRARKAESVNAT
jgi:chromosome segregation ATPase